MPDNCIILSSESNCDTCDTSYSVIQLKSNENYTCYSNYVDSDGVVNYDI